MLLLAFLFWKLNKFLGESRRSPSLTNRQWLYDGLFPPLDNQLSVLITGLHAFLVNRFLFLLGFYIVFRRIESKNWKILFKTFDVLIFFLKYFSTVSRILIFSSHFCNILLHVINMHFALSISKALLWVLEYT